MNVAGAVIRNPDEIRALKHSWSQDPCWDIEDTEGFGAHHDELLAWREEYEADREARDLRELERLAAKDGISVEDARGIRASERGESRAMEDAIGALKHVYRNAGGPDYTDMDGDFNNVASYIADIAEARVARMLTRALAKLGERRTE